MIMYIYSVITNMKQNYGMLRSFGLILFHTKLLPELIIT